MTDKLPTHAEQREMTIKEMAAEDAQLARYARAESEFLDAVKWMHDNGRPWWTSRLSGDPMPNRSERCINAVVALLVAKGIITNEEFFGAMADGYEADMEKLKRDARGMVSGLPEFLASE